MMEGGNQTADEGVRAVGWRLRVAVEPNSIASLKCALCSSRSEENGDAKSDCGCKVELRKPENDEQLQLQA